MERELALGEWPLSPVQQGLLLDHGDGSSGYIEQMICQISGDLDLSLFRQALAHVTETFDVLRCRFADAGAGRMRPTLVAAAGPVDIDVRDVSDTDDPLGVIDRFAALDVARGFDLSSQTSRCSLFRTGPADHVFVWTHHHLVADSWTLRLFQETFCETYRELFLSSRLPEGNAPSLRGYLDWVAHQDADEARAFWRSYLADLRRVPEQQGSPLQGAAPSATIEIRLGATARSDLDAARRTCKATANSVFMAAWAVCELAVSQKEQCLVGYVTAGRGVPVEGVVRMAGVMSNTIPALISDDISVAALIQQLRDLPFMADRYSYLSLGEIMASAGLRPADMLSVVNFTLDRREIKSKHLEDLPFSVPAVRYTDHSTFPTYLDVEIEADDISVALGFDPSVRVFSAERLAQRLSSVLRGFSAKPDESVRGLLDGMMTEEFDGGAAHLQF